MEETNNKKLEREYVIPLREKCRPVPRYKKTPKAVKTVKEFLVRHMQIRDKDLNKIKIDRFLNEQLWERGIKKPLHKVKVRVIKEGDIVKVYSVDLPTKINFKKLREEKREKEGKEALEKKKESQKTMMEKAKDQVKSAKEEKKEDKDNDGVNDKKEEKEKEKAVEEEMEKEEKKEANKEKHTTKPKSPKEQKDSQKKYNKSSKGQ
ncbi:MAG TPA: 50S ribosomal protein L31e [Candidatus Nanoarchaeia archaeon]|nr:50S ribosomal protein L31e [Candidatus Nanoarchaeia archaeon]